MKTIHCKKRIITDLKETRLHKRGIIDKRRYLRHVPIGSTVKMQSGDEYIYVTVKKTKIYNYIHQLLMNKEDSHSKHLDLDQLSEIFSSEYEDKRICAYDLVISEMPPVENNSDSSQKIIEL